MQHCGLAPGCTTCAGNSAEQAALRPSKSSRLLAPVWVQWGGGSCPPDSPRLVTISRSPVLQTIQSDINVSFKGPWWHLLWICLSSGACAGSGAVAEVLSLSSNTPVCVGRPGGAFTKTQECSEETVYTFPHSWDHVCYILCTSYIGKQLGHPWIPLLCLDTTSWVLPPANHRQAGAKLQALG